MTHVSVVLVKNINAVAGSYKKIPKRAKIIKIDTEAIRSIFLSLINKSNLFLESCLYFWQTSNDIKHDCSATYLIQYIILNN